MTQAVRYTVIFHGFPDPDDDEGDEGEKILDAIQNAIEGLPYFHSFELEDFEDEE